MNNFYVRCQTKKAIFKMTIYLAWADVFKTSMLLLYYILMWQLINDVFCLFQSQKPKGSHHDFLGAKCCAPRSCIRIHPAQPSCQKQWVIHLCKTGGANAKSAETKTHNRALVCVTFTTGRERGDSRQIESYVG